MAEFNFDGLLGNLFGGGGGDSELEKLLTAKQREQLGFQSTMAAAAALLKASGRSPQRIGLGQALGSALEAGQGAYDRGTTNAFQQMLLGEKLKEGQRARDLQTQVAGVLTKPPTVLTPEQQALRAPVSEAGPFGPKVARAELAASIQPPSANEIKAGQYQQIADIYASQGRSEDAKRFQEMSEKLNPRPEIVGQPIEVTDTKGNPILVQQYKDGSVKTMQGYGPKRDVVLQNQGGQTVAIDKSKLKGGETFAQTMTPAEIANLGIARGNLAVAQGGLGLRQQEFARSAFDRVDTPEGFFNVPKGGGVAVPVMGPSGQLKGAGGKPTEGETNAAGFAQRMELAQSIFQRLPAGSQPGVGTRMAEAVPFVGGALARGVVQSADTQMYDQAAQDWIRAKLRKESGAAIGVDEARQEYATYFPMVGDTPEKIAQKAEARRVVTEGMQKAAGKSYTPYTPLAPAPAPAPAPTAQPMMPGVPTWDPVKKQYVYQ
jgi:hypothetical protein